MVHDEGVQRAVAILAEMPSWIRSKHMDSEDVEKIMSSLQQLSRYRTATLRAAVEEHLDTTEGQAFEDVYARGRVYLLSRYIFEVPATAPPGAPAFGGWISPEQPPGNLLWPLGMDEGGQLHLISTGAGSAGMPYQVLDEFDYFREKYGRRGDQDGPQ